MITCPACGKENDDAAVLCRRCRGPLRDEPLDDVPLEHEHAAPAAHHDAPVHHDGDAHHAAPGSPAPGAERDVSPHHEAAAPHGQAGGPHDGAAQPSATPFAEEPSGSDSLGEVCRRCETYNEPGTRRCTTCGFALVAEAAQPAPAHDEPLDKTPAHPYAPPHHDEAPSADTPRDGSPSVADELSALALSPEEAAEAGLSTSNPARASAPAHHEPEALDKTPPHPFEPHAHDAAPSHDDAPSHEERSHEEPSMVARSKAAVAEAAGVAVGVASAAGAAVASAVRRSPEPPPQAPPRAEPPPAAPAPRPEPEQKACASCAALNPPAAKFCFDCGTPFAKKAPAPPVESAPPPPPIAKAPPPPEPAQPALEVPRTPARIEPLRSHPAEVEETAPSIHLGDDVQRIDATMETAAVSADETPDPDLPAVYDPAHDGHPRDGREQDGHGHELAGDHDGAGQHDEPALHGQHGDGHDEHGQSGPLAAAAAGHLKAEEEAPEAWTDGATPAGDSPAHEPDVEVEAAFVEPSYPEPEPELLAEEVAEPLPPFQASVVLERGPAAGTSILLASLESTVGSAGAAIEIADDPFVAPHAATVIFADDRLVLRDEGSANGVYVRVRETAGLEAGDHFIAGERLMRYDGPCELPQTHEGEVPFLGAPRPQGTSMRITEVLAGARTGRTCHRAGPTIALGRTGCDMNFPADSLLGGRHAEIRIAEDGSATLVDLGQGPSGVFLRVRAQGVHELRPGDVVRVGDQELRIEVG